MAAQIAREIELLPGVHVEKFNALPKPYVHLHGAAANTAGRPLANLVQLKGSRYRYVAIVELPRVQFCENEIEWTVNDDSEVTIEGQISTAAIFADKPMTGNRRNRVQLCPTEPWAISFYLPGPVEWWTTSVFFTTDSLMEIMVLKENIEAETSASGSRALVPTAETSTIGSRALIPETETLPADLTGYMTVVDTSFAGLVRYVPLPETLTTRSVAFVPAVETLTSGSTTVVPATETSATGSTAFVSVGETSESGSTASVPKAETSASSSTSFVSTHDSGYSQEPEGDTFLSPSEIAHMVDGWFK